MGGHTHQTHSDIIKRLRRVAGHLDSVVAMLEDERSCLDIAQQLHAVEKAITQAKRTLIQDHIDHCLDATTKARGSALEEFKQIAKYL